MSTVQAIAPRDAVYPGPFSWAGYTLGFGMSGFFDGILLHQILQWHHLLSGIESAAVADLRVQVMADGLFHALMYAIAAVGLWLLYRARQVLAWPAANRRLLANFWIGFGVWHVVDAVLSHWITGIHRIRMDSANPLPWDLLWLLLFGAIPLWMGWRLRRGSGAKPASGAGGPGIAASWIALVLAGAALAGAALNLFPPRSYAADTAMVVMRPDVGAGRLFAALESTDARILWADARGGVWVIRGASATDRLRLYQHGAMYVSGTVAPAGCATWLRQRPAAAEAIAPAAPAAAARNAAAGLPAAYSPS